MQSSLVACSIVLAALCPSALTAQTITVTAAPEVSAIMAACTPTDAEGATVRDDMMGRGWQEVPEQERQTALSAFSMAHAWSFLPSQTPSERLDQLDGLAEAIGKAATGETAAFLTREQEFALIMWDGDNISCLWAGPQTKTLDTLAVQLGGGFPESEGVTTRAITQTVAADGRDWMRKMAVGRTPVDDIPADLAGAALTDAARLDRSPK